MAYKRSLTIEGRRSLSNRYEDAWQDSDSWGRYCDCCSGPWRFQTSSRVERSLQVYRRKFKWLSKRYPKMIHALGELERKLYERTGRYNERWRQEMVELHGPYPE